MKYICLSLFFFKLQVVNAQFGSLYDISKSVTDPANALAVDIDGDGVLDMLCASTGDFKISWYKNLGSGLFGTQQIILRYNANQNAISDITIH